MDRDTRCEALVGLEFRGDARVLVRVRDALSRPSGDVWRLELVAAGALSDPQLYELVLAHQAGWGDVDAAHTADVVRRLTDPAGLGAAIFDGVAELYRRRAHGRPDGTALAAWHLMDEMLDIAPQWAEEFFLAVLERLAGDEDAVAEVRDRSGLGRLVGEASRGRIGMRLHVRRRVCRPVAETDFSAAEVCRTKMSVATFSVVACALE
jgi:hypothetical protein